MQLCIELFTLLREPGKKLSSLVLWQKRHDQNDSNDSHYNDETNADDELCAKKVEEEVYHRETSFFYFLFRFV